MLKKHLVILTAVAIEARAIAGVWRLPTPKPGRPVRTSDRDPSVEIHLVGIRAVGPPMELANPVPAAIVMAGLAGALDPSLKIGDVVLDDCPESFVLDVVHRRGKIHCSADLVSTTDAKRRLFETTGALAVDMESGPARALAEKLGVPFINIRAISDTSDEALDPAVLHLVDPYGIPRLLSIAATLVRRPGMIPYLKKLGVNSNLAAKNLAAAVRALASGVGRAV